MKFESSNTLRSIWHLRKDVNKVQLVSLIKIRNIHIRYERKYVLDCSYCGTWKLEKQIISRSFCATDPPRDEISLNERTYIFDAAWKTYELNKYFIPYDADEYGISYLGMSNELMFKCSKLL